MYCTQCGARLLENAKFCSECGSSMNNQITDVEISTEDTGLDHQTIEETGSESKSYHFWGGANLAYLITTILAVAVAYEGIPPFFVMLVCGGVFGVINFCRE